MLFRTAGAPLKGCSSQSIDRIYPDEYLGTIHEMVAALEGATGIIGNETVKSAPPL
jgi:hypothetical protein